MVSGNHAEGSNTHILIQNKPQTTSRATPRHLLCQRFEEQPTGNQGQQGQGEGFSDYLREHLALGKELNVAMSLQDFCTLKYRNNSRECNRGVQNFELPQKLGKLSVLSLDGSSKCTARVWVQKLDAYFQLNPMLEIEAIKFATLHLEGETHEWWYHGLVTLGHLSITSYLDSTQRLFK